jgi:cation transport ATPase
VCWIGSAGQGIKADIEGETVLVGNKTMLTKHHIVHDSQQAKAAESKWGEQGMPF